LQVIMQFVVVEVCASRVALFILFILPADAPVANPAIANTAKRMVKPRTTASAAPRS